MVTSARNEIAARSVLMTIWRGVIWLIAHATEAPQEDEVDFGTRSQSDDRRPKS
jgi:hypothetical protein